MMAHTTMLSARQRIPTSSSSKSHRRKFSDSKLLRSVPVLSRLATKSREKAAAKASKEKIQELDDDDSPMSPSPKSPAIEITRAPVMSRMLEARAEMAARPSFDLERLSGEYRDLPEDDDTGPTELAKKLRDIFEFDHPEEVIEGRS